MSKAAGDVASPCVNICQINPDTGLCLGCLRTLDEIACWLEYSSTEKLAVLKRIDERQRMETAH